MAQGSQLLLQTNISVVAQATDPAELEFASGVKIPVTVYPAQRESLLAALALTGLPLKQMGIFLLGAIFGVWMFSLLSRKYKNNSL